MPCGRRRWAASGRDDVVTPADGPSPDLSPQLRALMRRQLGVFTADQAYAVGYLPDEVQRLREAGTLRSLRRGVYALAAQYAALDLLGRHRADTQAALLRLKQPATLSHESAAVWTSLALLRPTLRSVHFTRPELRASRREAGIHHHLGDLPVDQRRMVDGVSVTGPARTAVDIARWTDFARGLAAGDSCLRDGTSRKQLQETMEFCSCWPGARRASRAVAAADGRAANPGESWSRAVLIEAGLEPTALQFEVRDSAGLIGFADFGWQDEMTLGGVRRPPKVRRAAWCRPSASRAGSCGGRSGERTGSALPASRSSGGPGKTSTNRPH